MELVITITLTLSDRDGVAARSDDVLNVWVLYDGASACNRALTLLRRVARGIEGEGYIAYALARFGYLAEPILADILAEEAAAADVIIVAAHRDATLPDRARDWISLRRIPRLKSLAALGAVIESDDADLQDSCLCSDLKNLARMGGLAFFVAGGGLVAQAEEQALARVLNRQNGARRHVA